LGKFKDNASKQARGMLTGISTENISEEAEEERE
jgi:hypothetical protein